jgi:hypothetical protein
MLVRVGVLMPGTGTLFVPPPFTMDDISVWLHANFTPSPLGADALNTGVNEIISLYSNDPSASSPYGTGNQTFGTGPGYKKASSICTSS